MEANMNNRFDNQDAWLKNFRAIEHNDAIVALTNAAKQAPDNLPQTYGALKALENGLVTRDLLIHYGLDPNPVATRNIRLRKFLGCRD